MTGGGEPLSCRRLRFFHWIARQGPEFCGRPHPLNPTEPGVIPPRWLGTILVYVRHRAVTRSAYRFIGRCRHELPMLAIRVQSGGRWGLLVEDEVRRPCGARLPSRPLR